MDDEKPAVAGPARVPTMVEGPPAASSSEPQKLAPVNDQRVRFTVELRPGETTIVSWKRLLKESGRGGGAAAVSSGVDPAFGGQVFSGANVRFSSLFPFGLLCFLLLICVLFFLKKKKKFSLASFRVCAIWGLPLTFL